MALPIRNFYLTEWLSYFEKSQADLSRDMDWNKAKVSLLCSGKQEFSRDDLFALADALKLEPYELLLHPDKAMSLRRMIADIKRIAGQPVVSNVEAIDISKKPAKHAKPAKRGTGTHG